jgi:TonB family protein
MLRILAFLLSFVFLQEPTAAPIQAPPLPTPDLCVLHVETLRYPPLARTANIQGEVKISAMVDETGAVILPALESGHPLLAQAALAHVRTWKFKPPSGGAVTIEMIYDFVVQSGAPQEGQTSFDFPNHVRIVAGPLTVESQAAH